MRFLYVIKDLLEQWDWELFGLILLYMALPRFYRSYSVYLVGNAKPGTDRYYINAAIVLSQHAGSGMKQETRAKLRWIAQNSSNPEARTIAQNALNGRSYNLDHLVRKFID